jgi:hypothetical protein
VLETGSAPDIVTKLQQQPDASVTLPAYLATLHGKQMRFDMRGVAERWFSKDDWMEWEFQVSRPGTYELSVITSEQKDGRGWEGGHKLSIDAAGTTLEGVVDADAKVENPANPYWPYVRSDFGRVRIDKPGTYRVALKPQSIESAKKFGLTLVSVNLKAAK